MVKDVEVGTQPFIRRPARAEPTGTRRLPVREVSTSSRDVLTEIFDARLPWRRFESDELDIGAIDDLSPDSCCPDATSAQRRGMERRYRTLADHRLNEVCEWRGMIHPSPPRQLPKRLDDTITIALNNPHFRQRNPRIIKQKANSQSHNERE